jgi:hypothetical protein
MFVDRDGMSDGGEFCQGFGALAGDDQRAALLWVYRHLVEPGEVAMNPDYLLEGEKSYDAMVYPHRAVLALVNWPIGLQPKNPAEVIGRVNVDETMGHYMFRNGWKDSDDLYFTFLLNPLGKHGYVRGPRGGNFYFWGLGVRSSKFGRKLEKRRPTCFQPRDDGGGVLAFQSGERRVSSIAVDYSEKAGVPGVVVIANPWFAEKQLTDPHWYALRPVKAREGDARFDYRWLKTANAEMLVMTIQHGEPPAIEVQGGRLIVGGQSYRFDGEKVLVGE